MATIAARRMTLSRASTKGTADAGDVYLGAVTPAFTAAADASSSWSVPGGTWPMAVTATATATYWATRRAAVSPSSTQRRASAIADSAVTTGTDGKSYVNNANFNGGSTTLTGQAGKATTANSGPESQEAEASQPRPVGQTVFVAADGTWSFPLTGLIASNVAGPGDESVSAVAIATDPAGNTASSDPFAFTVDTTTSESAIGDSAVTIGTDGQSYINAANFNGGATTLTRTTLNRATAYSCR